MSPVFRHGRLRLYLLRLLDEEPRHGYEVIRMLRDQFMGVYAPSPGTIYPRLARLEEEGLVTHDEVDGRKVYRITDAGRQELREREDELAELEQELSDSVRDVVREVKEDVRETVRSLREELTWAARNARPPEGAGPDTGRAAAEQARQRARWNREEARERARQARDDAKESARRIRDDAKEWARAEREQAKAERDQGRSEREQARSAGQDWGNWAAWADWPGRRGFPGKPDVRLLHDLEHTVKDFVREMRKMAWQASAEAGEDALTELRIILDETLDRVRSEIFGAEQRPSAGETSPTPEPPAETSSTGGPGDTTS
ncbi:MAG: helix-turn-helix transcriptional regulator [Actinobacteria bacterium]|nr:helix-turn-helix transcriptional regulator [Actinomycetota bacterium]